MSWCKSVVRFCHDFSDREIWYNEDMKLYQTVDGTLIGFYRERGGQVQAMLYRNVYEQLLVVKTREEEITIPGFYEIRITVVPGHFEDELVFVPGHYERQMVWHPSFEVKRFRQIDGHYEIQNIWVPGYFVTRFYWREAHPARGLEAAWIPYQFWIEAGYKDQRVWIPTFTEEYIEVIPAGERETRVWVEGDFVTEQVWVPLLTTSERVWIPPVQDTITVEYTVVEDVWIGNEPVYEFVDVDRTSLFEVLELEREVAGVDGDEDKITIRNMLTGEELVTEARYVGYANRIGENEFVVP